jgi:hypothetical protein
MESARSARTKTTINKIHTLLMERWESYTTRRVDINIIPTNASGETTADYRLLALRELMKLELPDRWSDILLKVVPDSNPLGVVQDDPILVGRPSLSQAYLRRYYALTKNDGEIVRRNQGAECLYMIVMWACGDGEARTLFSRQDIGDTDEDGAPEFLDGWGNPIQFIRWPAGFVSDLQSVEPITGKRLANQDHDPFDPFRRDQEGVTKPIPSDFPNPVDTIIAEIRNRNNNDKISAYRLVPLIYSQGPDDEADILVDTGAVTVLDPYAYAYGDNDDLQIGTTSDFAENGEGWHDNIHNHLMDSR